MNDLSNNTRRIRNQEPIHVTLWGNTCSFIREFRPAQPSRLNTRPPVSDPVIHQNCSAPARSALSLGEKKWSSPSEGRLEARRKHLHQVDNLAPWLTSKGGEMQVPKAKHWKKNSQLLTVKGRGNTPKAPTKGATVLIDGTTFPRELVYFSSPKIPKIAIPFAFCHVDYIVSVGLQR